MSNLVLDPIPPFRLDLTVWALRRWPGNRMDHWDGHTYRRVLPWAGHTLLISVVQPGPPDDPRLRVTVTGEATRDAVAPAVSRILARTLGVRRDLAAFYRLAASDPQLDPLVARFRGLKPPGFPTLFECLVNAIACQQVTLALGIRLLNQLAAAHGSTVEAADCPILGLPGPETVAALDIQDLRSLQFSRQKARALIELSQAVVGGELDLAALTAWGERGELEDAEVRARLRRLWGVGRWTVEYALLRGLGRLHIFPGDDVGAGNGLARWLGLSGKLDYDGINHTVARWHPYAGLVYFHLLLHHHAQKGYV